MPTPDAKPRLVAGLWCGEVLERLGDYVEGALGDTDRAAVEAHVHGCDWCARFGGAYAHLVTTLRGSLGEDDDGDAARRLLEHLDRALDRAR